MPDVTIYDQDDGENDAMQTEPEETEPLTASSASSAPRRSEGKNARCPSSVPCVVTILGITVLFFLLFSPAGVWVPAAVPVVDMDLTCLRDGKVRGEPLDLSRSLGKKMEPSGAVWREASETLLVVSDNGRVEEFTKEGERVRHWTVRPKRDMEGATWVPDEPDILYIAEEFPPTILKFNTTSGTIVKTYPLDLPLDPNDPNNGVEALTYLPYSGQRSLEALTNDPNLSPSSDGYFLVGIQATGDIYVFANPPQDKPFTHFRVPRMANVQRADLSDMTVFDHHVYFAFDTYKILARARLTEKADEWLQWEYFDLPERGTEALAFQGSHEGEIALFVGLDVGDTAALYRYRC